MRVQVELGIKLALRRQGAVEFVQEPPFELPRLDFELDSRGAIDNADRHYPNGRPSAYMM